MFFRLIVVGQPRAGDRFGESVSLYGNFLAVGCPGREDTWIHTGKVATDWLGEDVGAVYLYRRDNPEDAFSLFQVLFFIVCVCVCLVNFIIRERTI